MRAAIYLRVSTEQQVSGTSLDRQEENCVKKAESLGVSKENIDVFREEGYSGEDIDIRPKMTDLRKLSSENLYKYVICVHPDRLSRDMTDKLIICREFEKNGADLIFTDTEYNNSPEGVLFFNIMSSIAAYELALIKKRTVGGRIARVRNHKEVMPMRVPPFGYDWENKQLKINEDEAKYVKKIYDWYVHERLTLREIGERLYSYGVQPKRKESSHWNANSISKILTSEIYTGRYYYNKLKGEKKRGEKTKSGKPKISRTLREEKDWILVEVPSIVDSSLWHMAQKQRKKNQTFSGNVKHQYLLKSLLVCENCGRRWNGTTYGGNVDKDTGEKKKYRVYRCPNKNPKKYGEDYKECKNHTIRAEILEDDYIWNIILEMIKSPEEIGDKIVRYHSETHNNESQNDLLGMKENLNKKEEEKRRIKKMYQHGVIEEDEMMNDMKSVNEEIKSIEYGISELKQNYSDIDIEAKRQMVVDFLHKYKNTLDSGEEFTFEEKLNLIQYLIDKIEISIDEDNTVNMNVKGTITGVFDESNIESSSYCFDNVNTTQRVEMIVKSSFSLQKQLVNSRYSNVMEKSSLKNEVELR